MDEAARQTALNCTDKTASSEQVFQFSKRWKRISIIIRVINVNDTSITLSIRALTL